MAEFEYEWWYRGDWVSLIVHKNGVVEFDNPHESHVMDKDAVIELGDTLYNTVGPGKKEV